MSGAIFDFGADRVAYIADIITLGDAAQRYLHAIDATIGDPVKYVRRGEGGLGGWFYNFIRGNHDAVPLCTRDQREAAAYRFTLAPVAKTLVAEKRDFLHASDSRQGFEVIFRGSVFDFVNWGHLHGIVHTHMENQRRRTRGESELAPVCNPHDFIGQTIHKTYPGDELLAAPARTAKLISKAYSDYAAAYPDGHRMRTVYEERALAWGVVVTDAERQASEAFDRSLTHKSQRTTVVG